jgi:hypothetical protein
MLRRMVILVLPIWLFSACGPAGTGTGGDLSLAFAHRALDGPCPEEPAVAPQPPRLDRLKVSLYRHDGKKHYSKSIDISGDAAPTLSGIPTGDDLTLKVIGSSDGDARWEGSAEGVNVRSGKTTTASVFMTAVNAMSCTHAPLQLPRTFMAPARLPDGRILLCGGADLIGADACGAGCDELIASRSVDIFDPATGLIYPSVKLNTPRALATATRLPDGNILVVGGARRVRLDPAAGLPFSVSPEDVVDTFEVYLPNEHLWIEKPLPEGRVFHSATHIGDGKVLVAGGGTDFTTALQSAIMFDPAGESVGDFSRVTSNMDTPRLGHAAIHLGDGRVLMLGGATLTTKPPMEEFSSDTGAFKARQFSGSPLNLFFHSAGIIPLRPDEILLCGGSFFDGAGSLNAPMKENVRILSHISSSKEIDSQDGPSMENPHLMLNMVELGTHRLLVAGGFVDLSLTPGQAVELFDPTSTTFSVPYAGGVDTTLSTPRGGHSAITVSGGRALCAGGLGSAGLLGSAEIFTPGEVEP